MNFNDVYHLPVKKKKAPVAGSASVARSDAGNGAARGKTVET
jgi:hypothetical protein